MAIFDRMERQLSKTVDATFSLRFECHPQEHSPNGRSAPDSVRVSWLGKGILEEQPVYDSIESGKRDRTGNDFRTIHAGQSVELSVDRTRYPQTEQAKQKDRIRLDDLREFEIVATKPDGLSRIVFELVEIQ